MAALRILVCCLLTGLAAQAAVVNFADPNLEAVVREALIGLGVDPGAEIDDSELVGVGFTTLHAGSKDITDLSGLEHATDLENVDLSDNVNIIDITPLGALTRILFLDLTENQVADISPLASLTALQDLRLYDNQVSDLSPLSGLAALNYVILDFNNISDIAPLTLMSGLTYVSLTANPLSQQSLCVHIPALIANAVEVNFEGACEGAAPAVASVRAWDESPTNAITVQYAVTFSQEVTGVDPADFALTVTGVSGARVRSVRGSGNTFIVEVDTGIGDGTLRLDVIDNDSIIGASGIPLGGEGAGNGNFTGGDVYVIDKSTLTPRTFYVDDDPSTGGDGSSSAPFQTVGQALLAVDPARSDVIVVRPGVYGETLTLPPNVTLIGEQGAFHTHLRGALANADVLTLSDRTVVRGLTIAMAGTGAGARVSESASARITNCVFVMNGTGVVLSGDARADLVNNVFSIQSLQAVLVEASGTLMTLKNCIFNENAVNVSAVGGTLENIAYNFIGNGEAFPEGGPVIMGDPLFVDADKWNFHLRAASPARNAGDPGVTYNDRDGSRNDLGADGGPFGVINFDAPRAVILANPIEGERPLAVLFDGSESQDEFGIASYSWDFDDADGITEDAAGPLVEHTYIGINTYLATLTVRDNSGRIGRAKTTILAFDPDNRPPLVSIDDASPNAGPTPLDVTFMATGSDPDGGSVTYDWDFGDGGTSTEQDPVHTYPSGTPPGSYAVTLTVTDDEGSRSRARVFVTITDLIQDGSGVVDPAEDTVIEVARPGSPFDGSTVRVPLGATVDPIVITLSPIERALPQFVQDLGFNFDLGPNGAVFARPITVRVPHAADAPHSDVLEVWYYDGGAGRWKNGGISNVRHIDGYPNHFIEFETTHFTPFSTKSIIPRTILGAVTDAGSGAPVPNAVVSIVEAGLEVRTDDAGLYTFARDLNQGDYTVQVQATGYENEEELYSVSPNALSRLDFALQPSGGEGEGEGGEGEGEGGGRGCFGSSPVNANPHQIPIGEVTLFGIVLFGLLLRRFSMKRE